MSDDTELHMSQENGIKNEDTFGLDYGETIVDLELEGIMDLRNTNLDDPCLSEPAVERGRLDVNVQTVKVARSNSALKANMATYPMTAKPRGQALIIEIESYINDVQDQRMGSHYDVENLIQLFEQLGFEVSIEKNLDKLNFDTTLNEFAKNEKHRNAHMMILVILSHGRDGHVITSDGRSVYMERIFEMFNNQYCPMLKGKPKFFIIQACRGETIDKVAGSNNDNDVSLPKLRKRPIGNDFDAMPLTKFGDTERARPTWEDMIIAYSTIPGYVSIRDHEKGTWFIQSLVEVFNFHAHEKELIDLLRMTSERLSQFTNETQEKQTCNIELRHLYKRIYFNPGLFDAQKIGESSSPLTRRAVSSPRAIRRSKSNPPESPLTPMRNSYIDDEDPEH